MDGICGNFFVRSTKFDSIRTAACVKYFAQGLERKGGRQTGSGAVRLMERKGEEMIEAPVRQGKGGQQGWFTT